MYKTAQIVYHILHIRHEFDLVAIETAQHFLIKPLPPTIVSLNLQWNNHVNLGVVGAADVNLVDVVVNVVIDNYN